MQRAVGRLQADAARDKLLCMFNIRDATAARARKRRSACACAQSSQLQSTWTRCTRAMACASASRISHGSCASGLAIMPGGAQGSRCLCNGRLRGAQLANHAMTCETLSCRRSMCHDYINKVWCQAACCAGVAIAVEPSLRAMQMKPGGRRRHLGNASRPAGAGRQGRARASADVLHRHAGVALVSRNRQRARARARAQKSTARKSRLWQHKSTASAEVDGARAEVDGCAARRAPQFEGTEYCNDVDEAAQTLAPVVMESGGRSKLPSTATSAT